MNWQTAAILFAMVSVAVMPVLIIYYATQGTERAMTMVGKQYGRTVRWLLAIITLAFILFMAWGEIMFAPNGIAPV